jgi:hypothetical protein
MLEYSSYGSHSHVVPDISLKKCIALLHCRERKAGGVRPLRVQTLCVAKAQKAKKDSTGAGQGHAIICQLGLFVTCECSQ